MMSRRMHQGNQQLEALYMENNVLRERVNKIGEIQPYVNILLQNNKNYQEEISQLQIQNNKIRGKMDQLLKETLIMKQSHKNELLIVKNTMGGDIERLVLELKEILRDKEAMENANKGIIQELQSRFRRDLELMRIELEEKQSQYNHHVHKLTETLKAKDRQLEITLEETKTNELALLEKIQQLTAEVKTLGKTKQLLEQETLILTDENHALIRKNKELIKEKEDLSTKWLRIEQEKNQTIIELKNYNRELIEEIEGCGNQILSLEKVIAQQNRKINNLTRECEDISIKYNDLDSNFRRKLRELDDVRSQYEQISERLQFVNKTTNQELTDQADRITHLMNENKNLSKDNIELQSDNRQKKIEIEDLLKVIQRLENKMKELDENCLLLEDENKKFRQRQKMRSEELEQSLLQKKSLSEKLSLYVSHNKTLEEIVEKEKKKTACLQHSRNELQLMALSRPEGICKQYEHEIEKIVQQFMEEKKVAEENHTIEISQLRKAYELSLREKDEYFNRKIAFLQKEITSMRPIRSPPMM